MATALMARTIRGVINAHRGADKRANVLHFQVADTDVTPEMVDNVATDLVEFVTTNYKNLCGVGVVFDNITATDASQENGYQKILPLTGIVGTMASTPLPGNVAAVVTLHTAQPGRQGRGRVFTFEADATANEADGTFTTAYQNALQSSFQNLLDSANFTDQGFTLAVGSRKGLCSFPVTSVVAHDYVASQKDRLPGHRRHKKPAA